MIHHNMPKSTKKTEATGSATAAPTVDVAVVSASSSKKSDKTDKKPPATKATKSSKAMKEIEVVNEKVEITPTETSVEGAFIESFTEFMAKLQALASQMNSLKSEFRALEKKSVREIKAAQKLQAKRKRAKGNRSPSGFVKPTLISDELAKFLKKPTGTEMARTEVTREINGYIRANSLQDKQNGRKINPDQQLAALLKIGSGEELTYFNLQRYMSPHFAKATPKVASTSQ